MANASLPVKPTKLTPLAIPSPGIKNALERGVPNNEAVKLGTSASFADLPVGVLVNSFGLFGDSGKAIAKKLKIKPGTSGKIGNFITGSLEGAQEFYQRVIQNVSENAPATQGALKDGVIGFVVGNTINSMSQGVVNNLQDLEGNRRLMHDRDWETFCITL